MNDKKYWWIHYKCESCGETFIKDRINSECNALSIVQMFIQFPDRTNLRIEGIIVERVIVHKCKNQGFGIANFVGVI